MINLPSLSEVKNQLYLTVKRFPLPALSAAIITFLGIYLTHDTYPNTPPDWVWQGLITAMLGLVSLSALTLLAETTTKFNRGLIMLGGTALLGLYFWSLPSDPNLEGSKWIMRHIFLMLGSLVALTWIPYWRQKVSNTILWHWDSLLIGSMVVTLFFAIVLFLGLMAALWSVDMLFDLDIDGEWYFDIFIVIAALFSPLFFLSQFEADPVKLKAPNAVSSFMGIFTKYIMTPLATGYMVILYAYTAKILITWEWPKNVLGWLVIAFLGVAIFTYFLWTPLLKPSFEKYRRLFWWLLIPQIFLLFVAIGWRIAAYSWTENRYFVVVLGCWLLGTTLYFILRKNAQFKWIFIALTALIFVSQIGPFSGYNIGKMAQTNRLITLLTEVKVLQNGNYIPTKIDTDDETENQIASILEYLNNRYGEDILQDMFATLDLENTSQYSLPETIMEQLGLEYRTKWDRQNNDNGTELYRRFNVDRQQPFNIEGYDWKVTPTRYQSDNDSSSILGYSFKLSPADKTPEIQIYFEGQLIDAIDVNTKLETLLKSGTDKDSVAPEMASVSYESEALNLKIFLTNGWRNGKEDTSFEAEIYVRLKNNTGTMRYQDLSRLVEDEYLNAALSNPLYEDFLLEPNFNQNYHINSLRERGVDVEFVYNFDTNTVVNVRYLNLSSGTYRISNFNLESDVVQTCPFVGADYSGVDLYPANMSMPMTYRWDEALNKFVEVGISDHNCPTA